MSFDETSNQFIITLVAPLADLVAVTVANQTSGQGYNVWIDGNLVDTALAEAGDMLKIGIQVGNTGNADGNLWAEIMDVATGTVIETLNLGFVFYGFIPDWYYFTIVAMPNSDWGLLINVGH